MASTNADRVTFEANGQAQVEQTANGRSMRTIANLVGDRLEINSTGDRALDYQITVEPFNNGRNLRVTRTRQPRRPEPAGDLTERLRPRLDRRAPRYVLDLDRRLPER